MGTVICLLVSVTIAQLPFVESSMALRGTPREERSYLGRRHLVAWRMQDSILLDGHNYQVPNGQKMLKGTIPHIRRQNELNTRYRMQHERLATVMPVVNVITKAVVQDEKEKNLENHYLRTTGAKEYGLKETGVDVRLRHAHVAHVVGDALKPMLNRKNHHRVRGINPGGDQLNLLYSAQTDFIKSKQKSAG